MHWITMHRQARDLLLRGLKSAVGFQASAQVVSDCYGTTTVPPQLVPPLKQTDAA
jgi:hypothetical protein